MCTTNKITHILGSLANGYKNPHIKTDSGPWKAPGTSSRSLAKLWDPG
jgi:hypothetical protein